VLARLNAANSAANPVEHYLENISSLKDHLEVNYEYAKRVEDAIEQTRRKVAGDMLSMKERLDNVVQNKAQLQSLITEDHRMNVEQ